MAAKPNKQAAAETERLVRLEEQFSAFMKAQSDRHIENSSRLQDIDNRVTALQHTLSKYTGFWGAIMLVAGVIVTIATFAGDFLRRKVGLE